MGRRVKGLEFGRKKERKINLSLFREIIIWVVEIAITIVVAAVFTYFFGVRSTVVGPSMSPQLEDGNEVLIDRFFYKFISPKSGDIIAFLPNGNTNTHYYLKRVVAVPGDTVQIKDGRVYVNGEELAEEVEAARMDDAGLAENEITLAEDEYFVLGDNRNNSEDSRFANIGNIKESYIIGKAWFIMHRGINWALFNRKEYLYAVSVVSGSYDQSEAADAGRYQTGGSRDRAGGCKDSNQQPQSGH